MTIIADRVSELYEGFSNTRPRFIRQGDQGDAFVLLAFETVLDPYHAIRRLKNPRDLEMLEKSVVPPPDDGIDIFYQESDLEDRRFHIVQCKYSALAPTDIRECFIRMKDTVEKYLRAPKDVSTQPEEAH